MATITLTTDFGTLYPASMKAVILDICEEATIVDISHTIPQGDILSGAFALYNTAHLFPKRTVHVAVVDPGVGTLRKALILEAGGHYFVGPDNGLMIPAAHRCGKMKVWIIQVDKLFPEISPTFHGRDVFAPVGAYLASGKKPEELAKPSDCYVCLHIEEARVKVESMRGKVNYVDDFGNIVTSIPARLLHNIVESGDILELEGNEIRFVETYANATPEETVALVGSHGFLEIAVSMGNAAERLSISGHPEICLRKVTSTRNDE
ncbi:S-adenosylmethionine hydrolase [Methanohalophilus levihalophilus]|uniref:SAM hydrolase/SAM-dependent halogenase family protein n=1 Tax=Methanohalophilus levihalophilus TaxID=1431282 RepID=UPI001AEA0D6F|nr:S-adenosyl-l-methionine hydroxide adenosyltransferase family protein [Methanohalophilus levihalophilus]MBP2030046.1 S-adenosylmethionine hydrolase [Methanohalophilus levihalophilus]